MGLRRKFIVSIILFLIIFGLRFLCSNCQEINKDLIQSSGSGQLDDNRRQQHQLWQSVGSSLTVQGDTKHFDDKFYSENNEDSTAVRRRPGNGSGRKRKRRLQTYSTERIDSDSKYQWRGQVHDEPARVIYNLDLTTSTSSPSRIRTNQQYPTLTAPTKFLEKIREPLAALEKEQKLFEIRDKQRKEFIPSQLSIHDKSYRKPYSQAKKEESTVTELTGDQQQFGTVGASNLKNILKNSGGLSLSEILQQKNLSLDDLLKGKHNALQAIQTTASTKCFNENCKSNELTAKNTKTSRRTPSGNFQTTTIKPQNIQSYERRTTLQSNRPIHIKKRNQIRNENTSTMKTTLETETTDDANREKTPNVIEIATIATLRDNPPLRKNIVYPSRPKIRNYSTTERLKDTESTTRRHKTTTKVEEPTTVTTAMPAYRRRSSFRPKIKLPNLQKPIKNDSSSSSSESSESNSSENHRKTNFNRQNKTKEIFSFSYDSQEDFNDTSNKFTNFFPSGSSFNNVLPTTTLKVNQESVEEKLKQTKPEENFVDNFDDMDDLSNENVATLEELFADTSFKTESTSKNHIQVITPRIDRKKQTYKVNETDNKKNDIQTIQDVQNINTSSSAEITEINPSVSDDLTSDQSIDDRTELLELMEDRRSGNRLFKVLAQRNMTLDELIEHRKRGSSQVHLSEMLQQKSSQIFPATSNLQDNLDIVTAFENFPHFNLIDLKSVQPDEIKTDSQGASYFTSIIDIEPTDEIYKEGRSIKGKPIMQAQKQQQSENQEKLMKQLNFLPSWKSLSLASYAASKENNFLDNHNSGHHITSPNNVDLLEPTILKIEDDVVQAHDLLDLELSGHGFKRNQIDDNIESIHIPAGIQSAIIASSAIVAVSLIIFLFIFITCRWRQKRRKKLSYIEHYNAMKSKLPALISQQSTMKNFSNNNNINDNHNYNYNDSNYDGSNNNCGGDSSSSGFSQQSNNCSHISTIMFNGGRLTTMDPNSPEVHEYLYDAMRKPFRN